MKKVMTVRAVITTFVMYVPVSMANLNSLSDYLSGNTYLSSTFSLCSLNGSESEKSVKNIVYDYSAS